MSPITLIIPECNITKIYHAEKSGKDYLTIETGESTFNLSCDPVDRSKLPILRPVRFEAQISAFVYGKNQNLRIESFKVTPVTG